MSIQVFDAHTAGSINCTGTSHSVYGTLVQSVFAGSGYSWAGGYISLDLPLTASQDWGRFGIFCSVPRESGTNYARLIGYGWTEWEGDGM